MNEVINKRLVDGCLAELGSNFSGGYCRPWWAITSSKHLPNPVEYPYFKDVFAAFCRANSGKPIIESRQALARSIVVNEQGVLWFKPRNHRLRSTLVASHHEDDPYYDANAFSGSTVVRGEGVWVFGCDTKVSFSKDKCDSEISNEPFLTIDLSLVSIEEFECLFESSQFSSSNFCVASFNKIVLDLLERCSGKRLSFSNEHQEVATSGKVALGGNKFIFADAKTNKVVCDGKFISETYGVGSVFGDRYFALNNCVVKDIGIQRKEGKGFGFVCTVESNEVGLVPTLQYVKELIMKRAPYKEVVTELSRILASGFEKSSLSLAIYEMSQLVIDDQEHSETIEDYAAAIEGHCSSDFILHPSNYE
ncbi:hypothetical protein [Vibrio sp. D431a]|uniref:hypothetical protein n=1 Tax=Vibrio sp. D431a TaxID=2837388 RepID=UPI0025548F8B|nr:hypothetical protein [Vibrio sp. D431a]MDK9789918.1 hypothetical protein [Vibrio sp. D431a]